MPVGDWTDNSTYRPNQRSRAKISRERSRTPSPPPILIRGSPRPSHYPIIIQAPPSPSPPPIIVGPYTTIPPPPPKFKRSESPEGINEPKPTRIQRIMKWAQTKGTSTRTNVALPVPEETIEVVDDSDGFVQVYRPQRIHKNPLPRPAVENWQHQAHPPVIIRVPAERQPVVTGQPPSIIHKPARRQPEIIPSQPPTVIQVPPLQSQGQGPTIVQVPAKPQPYRDTIGQPPTIIHRPAWRQPEVIPSPPPTVMQVPRPQATSSSSRNSTRKEPEKFRATKAPSSRGTGLLAGQKPPSQGSRPATTESESRSGRKETKDFQTTRTTETQVHPPHGFATVEKQERSSQSRTERPSEASSNHDSDASSSESSAPSLKAFSGDHLPRAPTSYPHSHPQPLPPHPSSSLSERQNHGWTQQISIYIPAASKPSQQHSESPPPSFMPSPSAGSELSLPLSSLNGIPSNFGYIHSAPTNSQSVSSPMSMMSMPSPPGMASPEGGALYRGYEESLVGSVRSGRLQSTVKSERRDRDYR